MTKVFFLRSLETQPACPDILIGSSPVCVGRGVMTGITDCRVSRHHVTFALQEDGQADVTVTQNGPNPSVVNSEPLRSGDSAPLSVGGLFSLLRDKYPFKLMMFDQAEKRNDDKADRARASVSGSKEVRKSHWTQGLLSSMNDPEFVLHSTTDLVIIRDKYPKSTHHLLVIPKKPIDSINNLVQEDVSLLEQMEDEATKFVTKKFGESEFLMGYHAVPSMSQLHLHVISRDFVSDCLKHKKHWNSFTTGYFLSSSSVIKQLKEAGSVRTLSQQEARHLLTLPLQCNQCPHRPKNIPDLKRHLKEHFDMR